jgi:hypothetical protein
VCCLGEIFGNVFRIAVAALWTRTGKDPRQVGVREIERIATLATDSTWWRIGGTEQRLSEPQRESLLANAGWPVEQKTLRQRPGDDSWKKSFTNLVMPVKRDYRHAEKLARFTSVRKVFTTRSTRNTEYFGGNALADVMFVNSCRGTYFNAGVVAGEWRCFVACS